MVEIKINLVADRVESNSLEAFNIFSNQRLGEQKGEKIVYSLQEVLFLVDKKLADVFDFRGKKIAKKDLMKKFLKIDKKFWLKYVVFNDLRKRGYIVKTALKFGADFRVYDKKNKVGKDHARWVLYVVPEHQHLTWQEFSAKNRVAHSTNKNLLLSIVDDEDDVSYYEVSWVRL